MNARERTLLITLIGAVGVGGTGLAVYVWFVKPLRAYDATIRTLREERDLEARKWEAFLEEDKKLELARLRSLPSTPADAQSMFSYYLERSAKQSGLSVGGIQPSAATRLKPVGTIPGAKEVGHLTMSFTVTARGELSELVNLMQHLQAAPYEHRIRAISIDRADQATGKGASTSLTITMIIEALLVAKNENRPGHPPGVNTESLLLDVVAGRSGLGPVGLAFVGNRVAMNQLAPIPAARRYGDIARRNVFVGAVPIEKKTFKGGKSPGNIPRYIRLVHTVPSQQEAFLLNLYYRNEELKLSANPKTGYQTRRISDDNGDFVFFFMKVLRVDSGVVYFQVKDDVFSIQLGQSLDDAVSQEPYTDEELAELGIMADAQFAKEKGGGARIKGGKGK